MILPGPDGLHTLSVCAAVLCLPTLGYLLGWHVYRTEIERLRAREHLLMRLLAPNRPAGAIPTEDTHG